MSKYNFYTFTIDDSEFVFINGRPLHSTKANRYNKKNMKKVESALAKIENKLLPGTILDENYEIVFQPIAKFLTYNSNSKYVPIRYIDGTYFTLWEYNGKKYMATGNSWDISNMRDLGNIVYKDLLIQTLSKNNMEFDDLKLNTLYVFSNPNVHLTSHNYEILEFNEIPEVSENINHYRYYKSNNIFVPIIEKNYENTLENLYKKRIMQRKVALNVEDNYRLCVLKLICNMRFCYYYLNDIAAKYYDEVLTFCNRYCRNQYLLGELCLPVDRDNYEYWKQIIISGKMPSYIKLEL